MGRTAHLLALTLILSLGTARAAETAKDHFTKGSAHFAIGEFAEAATEYEAAYKLKQDPALLFNAAQAHRLAGHHEKALILYKNYIRFFPKEPNIAEVRSQLDKLEAAIAADKSAKSAPPQGTETPEKPLPDEKRAEPAPAPTTATTTSTSTSTSTTTQTAASTSEKKPVYKKWWLWTIVGVVVAAGVVTGVVLAVDKTPWANTRDIGPGTTQALGVRF